MAVLCLLILVETIIQSHIKDKNWENIDNMTKEIRKLNVYSTVMTQLDNNLVINWLKSMDLDI